jgi:hypothetical protein
MSAMVVAGASMVLSNAPGQAQTAAPAIPSFLIFTGTDLWRYGDFFYGGALWSPAGLNGDGFTGISQQSVFAGECRASP